MANSAPVTRSSIASMRSVQQALRRDVEQVQVTVPAVVLDAVPARPGQRGVQEGGAHAELAQRVDLVLHQRDQRRHDDAAAGAQQRRDLVAQGLAAARGHEHQGVAAGDQTVR
jgi:hypothetical protein